MLNSGCLVSGLMFGGGMIAAGAAGGMMTVPPLMIPPGGGGPYPQGTYSLHPPPWGGLDLQCLSCSWMDENVYKMWPGSSVVFWIWDYVDLSGLTPGGPVPFMQDSNLCCWCFRFDTRGTCAFHAGLERDDVPLAQHVGFPQQSRSQQPQLR